MATTHAIMICTPRAAAMYQTVLMENVCRYWCWDYYTAKLQKYLIVYALKNPLFYQKGIQEKYTNFTLENIADFKNKINRKKQILFENIF